MSIIFNGTEVKEVIFNGTKLTSFIVNGVELLDQLKIVDWATGSWEDILAMLDAHYQGKIDIADYWHVGDTRQNVALTETASVSSFGSGISNQNVDLVIIGIKHDNLSDGSGKSAITVSQKNCLKEAGSMQSSDAFLNWSTCQRRAWMPTYKNALPSIIKPKIKTVSKISQYRPSSGQFTSVTTNDEIFLASNYEVCGSTYYDGNYPMATIVDGTQYEYYKTNANRVKFIGTTPGHNGWVFRTQGYNSARTSIPYYVMTYNSNTAYTQSTRRYTNPSAITGICPAFCL